MREGTKEKNLIVIWIYTLIRIFLKRALHFLSLRGDQEELCHMNVLSPFTTAANVVNTQNCHLVSGRGGKQEAKLRSSTYQSTHFCHMKSRLSILDISETVSWQFRSFLQSLHTENIRSPAEQFFCLPDAGFILAA